MQIRTENTGVFLPQRWILFSSRIIGEFVNDLVCVRINPVCVPNIRLGNAGVGCALRCFTPPMMANLEIIIPLVNLFDCLRSFINKSLKIPDAVKTPSCEHCTLALTIASRTRIAPLCPIGTNVRRSIALFRSMRQIYFLIPSIASPKSLAVRKLNVVIACLPSPICCVSHYQAECNGES